MSRSNSYYINPKNAGIELNDGDPREIEKPHNLEKLTSYVKDCYHPIIRRGDVVQTFIEEERYRNDGLLFWDGTQVIPPYRRIDYSGAVPPEFVVTSTDTLKSCVVSQGIRGDSMSPYFNPNYWSKEVRHNGYVYLSQELRQSVVDSLKFDNEHTIYPCFNGTFVCQGTTYFLLVPKFKESQRSEAEAVIMSQKNPFDSHINGGSKFDHYDDDGLYNEVSKERQDNCEFYCTVMDTEKMCTTFMVELELAGLPNITFPIGHILPHNDDTAMTFFMDDIGSTTGIHLFDAQDDITADIQYMIGNVLVPAKDMHENYALELLHNTPTIKLTSTELFTPLESYHYLEYAEDIEQFWSDYGYNVKRLDR